MDASSSPDRPIPRVAIAAALIVVAGILLWTFPLFRIVPLQGASGNAPANTSAKTAFDPAATAAKLCSGELRAAAQRTTDAAAVVNAIRADPATARQKHARSVGMGAAYYFVRGSGKVIARDRSFVRVALDGPQPAIVALRIGPIFGNAVRDGTGLIDVNQVPGLNEFNALAAELNKRVESDVLPVLREKADVGAVVTFAGCAEAPESAPAADEPVLRIVPVLAEVRG